MSLYRVVLLVCIICFSGIPLALADNITPAFDASVKAASSVNNAQNMMYSSSARASMVGDENSPARVSYDVSVGGYGNNSGNYTAGLVKTEFRVSTLEARGTGLNESAVNEWSDVTRVSGVIRKLMKNFDYASGIKL